MLFLLQPLEGAAPVGPSSSSPGYAGWAAPLFISLLLLAAVR